MIVQSWKQEIEMKGCERRGIQKGIKMCHVHVPAQVMCTFCTANIYKKKRKGRGSRDGWSGEEGREKGTKKWN